MGSERIHSWLKCCRLCLMDDGVKMPIFGEEGIHREVAKKIESCLPIVIYNSDPLSKLICQRCLFMLDTVYDFHQKCVQTTVVLTNQLLAIKNSSAVTVYLLTLEKNDLLACSTSGKDPKRKHPTPDQIPVEDVFVVGKQPSGTSHESQPTDPLAREFTAVRIKQEGVPATKTVPQIVNVVGSYSGELRSRSYTPISPPESTGVLTPSEIKQEPGATTSQATPRSKRITPWYCKFCNKYYKNKGTLYKHRKYFCSKKGFECHKCTRVFAVENDKLVHLATHLRVHVDVPEGKLVTCSQCEKRFLNKPMLENHMKIHRYAATVAPVQNASSESDVSEREQVSPFEPQRRFTPQPHSSGSRRYHCEYCPRSYAQKGKLNRHKSIQHRREMITILPNSFTQPRSVSPPTTEDTPLTDDPVVETPKVLTLQQRMNRPSPLSKKKPLNTSTLLRELLLKQQGPVPKCEQCNKPFESRQGLSNHMRIHLPKNKKVVQRCQDCGKMFGSREGLRYHTNKFHRGFVQNKHHCRICDMSFTSRSEWLLHMVTHPISKKGTKSDPSGQAGVTDEIQAAPPQPMVVKPVGIPRKKNNLRAAIPMMPTCIYCDQEFDEVAELTAHLMTVHGLPRHFPCKVCFKLFAHRSNMARHTKIHQRPNQYTFHPCNICGKKFLSKETADKHASMHMLSQTFHCPQCNKIFFKMEGLQNHLCSPGSQTDDSNDCPSCNFPYTKGHECQYREDGSRIIFIGNKVPKKKKKSQHRSGRFYKCKHCVATFTSSYSHNSHMKIHTGMLQAKNNVILTVPSFAQPHVSEIKAEPTEPTFEGSNFNTTPPEHFAVGPEPPGENGFAWMHPENLEGVGTGRTDGSGVMKMHSEEPKPDRMSDSGFMESSHEESKHDRTGDDGTGTSLPKESGDAEGFTLDETHTHESKEVKCDPLDGRGSTGVHQESKHVHNTSLNESGFLRVRPQVSVYADDTSLNESGFLRVRPQVSVCADDTSLKESGFIRVRPQVSVCADNTSLKESGFLRVRPQESGRFDNTSVDVGNLTSVLPQESECVDAASLDNSGLARAYPKVSRADDIHPSRSVASSNENTDLADKTGCTETRPKISNSVWEKPSTTNHSEEGGHVNTSDKQRKVVPGSSVRYSAPMDLSYSAEMPTVQQARTHVDPDEIYDCNICSRAFSTPEELTTHRRWHGGPNKMPFKCPFCERGFVNSPAVYQHVLMNHKEQRY